MLNAGLFCFVGAAEPVDARKVVEKGKTTFGIFDFGFV
jgi:hypothetical protein